jgi:hypothetical protein
VFLKGEFICTILKHQFYCKKLLLVQKGEIGSNAAIVEDFCISLTSTDTYPDPKKKRKIS